MTGTRADTVPVSGARGYRVLVFTRTTDYRHDSIPAGVAAIRELGAAGGADGRGFRVEATEDPTVFDPGVLDGFRVVVFCNTSGDVFDGDGQRAAFEGWVRGGGGFVGVHSAANTEYGWPFYGELVGAYFTDHPDVQPATVRVEDAGHPATAHLPARWDRVDEWYNFRASVRGAARVLTSLDEGSYRGGTMGGDHPHSWCRALGAGRSFYTAAGHTIGSYAEPALRAHLAGAIAWAAGPG